MRKPVTEGVGRATSNKVFSKQPPAKGFYWRRNTAHLGLVRRNAEATPLMKHNPAALHGVVLKIFI